MQWMHTEIYFLVHSWAPNLFRFILIKYGIKWNPFISFSGAWHEEKWWQMKLGALQGWSLIAGSRGPEHAWARAEQLSLNGRTSLCPSLNEAPLDLWEKINCSMKLSCTGFRKPSPSVLFLKQHLSLYVQLRGYISKLCYTTVTIVTFSRGKPRK